MPRMAENKPVSRLTESFPGRLVGWLLAALWIFSMSGVDSHAFSSYPVCLALGAVLVLVLLSMLFGLRLVRMSLLGCLSLAAGGFFLLRCMHSYAVVDSWCEAVLILGAFVYYVAGVYVAQNQSYKSIVAVLVVALLLNILALWATKQPWFELVWTGRAQYTPAGSNSIPRALFIYKNFAGVFLSLGGCVLAGWAFWKCRGLGRAIMAVLAVMCILGAFACHTRAVYLVLLVCGIGLWGFTFIRRLFAHEKLGLGVVSIGVVLFVGGGVVLYDFFFGHHFLELFHGVDSHLRYLIWASVCEVLPRVPLWGCGANVTQWEIVPFYCEWQLPNYAHNEYLQIWVDYGLIGVVLAFALIVLHLVQGFLCIASEEVDDNRRIAASLSMLVLITVAVYAVVDFPWHSFALLSMCAFVCGVLASPFRCRKGGLWSSRRWASGSHAPVVGVMAQKLPGRLLLMVLGVALLAGVYVHGKHLRPAWHAQWEYQKLCRPGVDASGDLRRDFIAGLMPQYPSPALADTYFMLPPCHPDLPEREQMLKQALAANPKQLFTAVMLVDVLGEQGKCREAEMLMRSVYEGEAMRGSLLSNWPAYYALNLLRWGRLEMRAGNHATALSMFEYALNIDKVSWISFSVLWRSGPQPWKEHGGVKSGIRRLISIVKQDVRMLRQIGAQPDDSWQQPLTSGGRPALYQAWGKSAR